MGKRIGATQSISDSYGRDFAKNWGIEEMPSIVARSLPGAALAIADLQVNIPNGELSQALPSDDAYMICLVLRDLPENSYWEEEREVGRYSLRRGQTAISDLRRKPAAVVDQPIHTMLMHLPRATLNALADQANAPHIQELQFQPGLGRFDDTIMHLGLSLLPALEAPDCVNRLFTDHISLALASHVAQIYGGMEMAPRLIKGGLAPWQEKRSKEMIAGDLTGSISLEEIAAACGLSVSHFSRAFRKSTGYAPHAWLLRARVEMARAKLRTRDVPLSTIARECGFANQSHLSRVFTGHVGLSPGAWRKIAAG